MPLQDLIWCTKTIHLQDATYVDQSFLNSGIATVQILIATGSFCKHLLLPYILFG